MNKANHVLKAALAAAGLVGAVTMSALPVVAVAQDPKPPKLNPKVQKPLAAAQEAIQAKDWAKATADHRQRPAQSRARAPTTNS